MQLKVLFKKGDPKLPENYRPIAVIPILYKLFAKVLCNRNRGGFETEQSVDQAGFRSGFCCDDNLFAVTMLSDKLKEYNLPLWVAAVDFRKAFDTVDHQCLWQALRDQHVPGIYVAVLKKLYCDQSATVKCDAESRVFAIQRGTKQGDPISPLLFNTVLEQVMRPLKQKWMKERKGIKLGAAADDTLQSLRFADDLLLIASSRKHVQDMLRDLMLQSRTAGLEVHLGN